MKVLFFIISTIAILATSSFAGLEILEVHDVNITYISPEGQGKIGKFKFGVDTARDSRISKQGDFLHDVFIKVVGDDIFVESDFSYVIWRDAPSMFLNAHKIVTRNLELYFTLSKNSLKADKLQYDFDRSKFQFFNFDALCSDHQRVGGIAQRLLENCLFKSSLATTKFEFQLPKKVVQEVVETTYGNENVFEIKSVSNFLLTIERNNAHASFVIDWLIDAKATLAAKLTPKVIEKKLVIDIDKILLGKINVTKLTLYVLKKANLSGIEIKDKTVTVSF